MFLLPKMLHNFPLEFSFLLLEHLYKERGSLSQWGGISTKEMAKDFH